jgi:hypothetical protein
MHYVFILKNEKLKSYGFISLLLVVFNLLGFSISFLTSEERLSANFLLLVAVAITAGYTFIAINNNRLKKETPALWHRSVFLICVIVWMFENYWWLSIALVFFIWLDLLTHRKLEVKISETGILIPSLIRKRIEWNELNNLILKDGLLTIDFKNNKLIQQLILNPEKEVDEKGFNAFCRCQLIK